MLFLLEKKEKYYAVADDVEVEERGKDLWVCSVIIKRNTVHFQCQYL